MNYSDEPDLVDKPKKMHPIIKILLFIITLLVIVAAGVGFVGYSFISSPASATSHEVQVTVHPGTNLNALAKDLVDLHVITSARKFVLMATFFEMENKVKSGRFMVDANWNPKQVLDHLVNGLPILDRITIPEGLTWWETGKRLEAAGLVNFADFKTVVFDPAFLRYWGIPFPSAEGFLFPDTYLIMRPLELNVTTAKTVVGRLIDTFWRRTAILWPNSKRPGPNDAALVREKVILASIVEKETSIQDERSRVAGVYINRLAIKMLLQADPTTIYGLGENFTGSLLRSQLQDENNPYNTYKQAGLPPGPICSPGMACLRAVFQPEVHNYLYFVARGDGSHTFSSNLNDHNRAVRIYRSQTQEGDTESLMPGKH